MSFKGYSVVVLSLVIPIVCLVLLLSACGRASTATPTQPAATATPSIQSTVRAVPSPTPAVIQLPPTGTLQPVPTSQPAATLNPTIEASQGRLPPHRFVGTVVVDGKSVADGTRVTALIDGAEVARTTSIGGYYRIDVLQPQGQSFDGRTVRFSVQDRPAERTGTFIMGELTELNLTVGR